MSMIAEIGRLSEPSEYSTLNSIEVICEVLG